MKTSAVATLIPTIEEAVKDADYISMHLPLTDETRVWSAKSSSPIAPKPRSSNSGRALCINAEEMVEMPKRGRCAGMPPTSIPMTRRARIIRSSRHLVTMTPTLVRTVKKTPPGRAETGDIDERSKED